MQVDSPPQPNLQSPNLARFRRDRYPAVKARYPSEGRRKWRLRAADAFWALSPDEKAAYLAPTQPQVADPVSGEDADADFAMDADPLDALSRDAPGLGILVRTDYTHEDAWQTFRGKLQDAEAEFAAARLPEADSVEGDAAPSGLSSSEAPPTAQADDAVMDVDDDDDDGDEDEDGDEQAPPVFSVIDADPAARATFNNISNLAALRLLNDVDVRRAPAPAPGTKRIKPPNRLVEHDGWQEVYTGKMIWLYDATSNADQCVRVVSQQSGPYGTATGDSWRARVSHLCELQVGLASGAMTIDFGGLDRWDYQEQVRNLAEASKSIG